jgi:hypothetical protein
MQLLQGLKTVHHADPNVVIMPAAIASIIVTYATTWTTNSSSRLVVISSTPVTRNRTCRVVNC